MLIYKILQDKGSVDSLQFRSGDTDFLYLMAEMTTGMSVIA